VRERTAAYDAHFQAASAAQLVPGTLLPVPSYSTTSPNASSRVVAVGGPAGIQQYVPVTMVEQGGRLMVGATWAAPSGRQMTLVPSWQQLPHPQAHAHALAQAQPTHGTLLVPAETDWRRPLLDNAAAQSIRIAQDQMFPVVYDRTREARSDSYSSGSKRSTGYKQQPALQHSSNSSSSSGSQQRFVKKETAVTQLSPVKKRIKENKDHYIVADRYPGQARPNSWEKPGPSTGGGSGATAGPHLTTTATPTRPLEVITISDSEDEDKAAPAVVAVVPAPVVPVPENATPAATPSGPASACPSVMTVTPQQSAPPPPTASPIQEVASRPESSTYLKTPIKVEQGAAVPTPTPGMSQKKRLLAKAQSDWTLAETKPEPTEPPPPPAQSQSYQQYEREKLARHPSAGNARYGSYEYLERDRGSGRERERERFDRIEREKEREAADRARQEMFERIEREERHLREREAREHLERERAEFDYQAAAMAARERDLREQLSCIVPRLELAPPLAHQTEYGLESGLHRGVEYIQPPAAHSNRDLLAIHRGSQHYGSPASHHDSLYAPATVYVTAAGYQQIAIPPPAHHARPVLPPPMQPAAVFQHPPVVGAQYAQYAPLSPGKTRYLY